VVLSVDGTFDFNALHSVKSMRRQLANALPAMVARPPRR
jgi:hypothetical protein